MYRSSIISTLGLHTNLSKPTIRQHSRFSIRTRPIRHLTTNRKSFITPLTSKPTSDHSLVRVLETQNVHCWDALFGERAEQSEPSC